MPDSVTGTMDRPISGTGIGLRHCHIQDILSDKPAIPWFEILADNHLEPGGPVKQVLEIIRQDYAFSFHCVGMSLGGTDPLDRDYLQQLKQLMRYFEPGLVSDHLSFSSVNGRHYHELLPLPYTDESLRHVCQRITEVQDILGRRILVENPSSYLSYQHSHITEWEFMNAMATEADCHILLDVNNVYVSAFNHGFDANHYLKALSYAHVKEIHLGGFDDRGHYLLDAHNHPVAEAVWQLYASCMDNASHIPTLIEWDNDIPAFDMLTEQARLAESIRASAMSNPSLELA